MSDPLGLIGGLNGLQRLSPLTPQRAGGSSGADGVAAGPDFKQFLSEQLQQVNALQDDATVAVEDLASGRRDDIEGVVVATQKADIAFQMLLQVRNRVMEAYDEIKQIRV
jgi:flagellar hook-basal body complex protein FliE